MVPREVVRGREAVRAAADDDDVVVPLERAGPLQDHLAEEDVLHSAPTRRQAAAAERRGAVDRDLRDVVAELLGEEHPVAAVALEDVTRDVRDLAARTGSDGGASFAAATVPASGPVIASTV